jgi:hypothetical protein
MNFCVTGRRLRQKRVERFVRNKYSLLPNKKSIFRWYFH